MLCELLSLPKREYLFTRSLANNTRTAQSSVCYCSKFPWSSHNHKNETKTNKLIYKQRQHHQQQNGTQNPFLFLWGWQRKAQKGPCIRALLCQPAFPQSSSRNRSQAILVHSNCTGRSAEPVDHQRACPVRRCPLAMFLAWQDHGVDCLWAGAGLCHKDSYPSGQPPRWPSGWGIRLGRGRSGVRISVEKGFFRVESYQWLQNWHSSSGYPTRCLPLQGQCWDWSARCQYTATGWGRKLDLQLLSQCGST